MIIPRIRLTVRVIRGVALDGAGVGLADNPNPVFSKLRNGRVWLAAYPQVFFSMSIGFGFGLVCISGARLYWLNIVFLAPLISIILLTTAFVARIEAPYEGYPRGAEFIGAAVMFMIILVAAIIFSRRNGVGAVAIELSKKPD